MRFVECWLRSCLHRPFLLVLVWLANLLATTPGHARVSWIVMEADSGRVLEETGADQRHYPASLTKMMTLYMTFKALDARQVSLRRRFHVSPHAASREPTKLGLRAGQTVPLEQLILGLVTQSANDAAVVIAEGLHGTERAFARQMTLQAHELGMRSTVFRNASGLPDRQQTTTARDMARLAQALLRDFPELYKYFSTPSFAFRGRPFRNHNRLLRDYPGADGIKTGYTRASGFNLVASASRDRKRLVAVVLGGATSVARDGRVVALLDAAFARLSSDSAVQIAAQTAPRAGEGADAEPSAAGAPAPDDTSAAADVPAAGEPSPADWSIQVGAFARREAAERWADRLIPMDPRITSENERIVEMAHEELGTVYAVRFSNLDATEAADLCRALAEKPRDCFVVAPVR